MTQRTTIICDRCKSGDRDEDASDEWVYMTIVQVDKHTDGYDLCPVCMTEFRNWFMRLPPLPKRL